MVDLLLGAGLALAAIAAGAGLVLGALSLAASRAPPAPLDPIAALSAAMGVIKQARELDPPESDAGELRATLRAERAALRADFAEAIEQAEGVAETVQRHRKKAQQVAQRAAEAEPEQPAADDLEARRRELVTDLRRQGKL